MRRNAIKQTLRRTIRAVLITSAGLTASGQSAAAPIMGWTAQIDPMYMAVFGMDEQIATISRRPPTPAGAPDTFIQEGVDLEMDGDFAIRGEVQYMASRWGVGASGFWFNPEGDVDRVEDLNGFSGVSIFSNNIGGSAFTGGPNRVTYSADNDLEVWTADFYGIRTLAETPDSHVHMLAGLKIGGIEDDFSERAQIGNVAGGVFTPTAIRTSRASSDSGVLIGPLVGVAGDASYDRHRVKGLLQQSMLFGEADADRRTEHDNNGNGVLNAGDVVSTTTSSHDVGVPITEVGVKYLYDVTENIALGLGGFASVWWDAPTAPGVDDSLHSTDLNEQTLVFLGGMGTVEARF